MSAATSASVSGLSPPARGIPGGLAHALSARRSIPARAGDPCCTGPRRPLASVYPRPRGGSEAHPLLFPYPAGLSPPARGILRVRVPNVSLHRSIPACAGHLPNYRRTDTTSFTSPLDSRFRGNDGVETGNDGAETRNDGAEIGNVGRNGQPSRPHIHPFALIAPSRHCVKFSPARPPRIQKTPVSSASFGRPGRGLVFPEGKTKAPAVPPAISAGMIRRTLCPGGSPRAGDRDAPDNGERIRRSLLAPRAFGPRLGSDFRKKPAARSHHIGRR